MKNYNKGKEVNNILLWLENWYRSQCDGDWEHEYGIKIGTLDNPKLFLNGKLFGIEGESLLEHSLSIFATAKTDNHIKHQR